MEFLGGCQCGRVRYRAEGPRGPSTVCYCRMCQKASGAPFMAFVRFAVPRVTWSEPPAIFASSNVVERGFCRDCGTPLSYHQVGGPNVSLTLNSLDDPDQVQPALSNLAECRAAWLQHLHSLPGQAVDLTGSEGFVSHQRP